MTNKLKIKTLFPIMFYFMVFCVLGILSFNKSIYLDKVIFAVTALLSLVYFLKIKAENPTFLKERTKGLYRSAKYIYISLSLILIWDLITLFYSRDVSIVLLKYGYFLEYLAIFIMGIYFLSNEKRIITLIKTIAITGTLTSIGTYIYYFFSLRPIYFKRLATATDYNVFTSLIFVGLIFMVAYLMYFSKENFKKRFAYLVISLVLNIPPLYLAGSRRMKIMMPCFFAVILIYVFIDWLKDKKVGTKNFLMVFLLIGTYFSSTLLVSPFTSLGEHKEQQFKKWELNQMTDLTEEERAKYLNSGKENSLPTIYATIEDNSMSSKRSIIYRVAFDEIKSFNPTELVFGKGAFYDLYMYSNTNNEELLTAYGYINGKRPPKVWLSVHNFLLSDLLSGGIIKFTLSLFFVISIVKYTVILLVKDRRYRFLLSISLILTLINNFISERFGLMNDIVFVLILTIICSANYLRVNSCKEIPNEQS